MCVSFYSLLDRLVDVYVIGGIETGYIDVRVDRRSVPSDVYVYEVRDTSGDGGWYIGNVENYVLINHAGTIFSRKPLPYCIQNVMYILICQMIKNPGSFFLIENC